MAEVEALAFGEFRLQPGDARLWREGRYLALSPKAFDVLVFLCRHGGRLVTKEELLDGVWGHQYLSDGVIKNAVQELRRVLGDDPRSPRYIETVHRRGYRFIAPVAETPVARSMEREADGQDPLVGRAELLAQLDGRLAQARAGRGGTVFLGGEAGIGKTTLIQAVAARAAGLTVLRGQCVDHYGQGEPYLPLLDAINQLTRAGGEPGVRALRQYAPTWLAQLPWLVDGADREGLAGETQGATPARMLRELGEFLQAWSAGRPLLLVLEDLHWSDHATLDALTYLTRRGQDAHWLLLGSYRPGDVLSPGHPFRAMRDELLLHGLCHDLVLPPLERDDVARYLALRFPDRALTENFIDAVHRRTEGLPLFLARMADEMSERGAAELEAVLATLPAGLKHLVDLQFDRLEAEVKPWVDVAAVSGDEFSADLLAAVTGSPALEVEEWCERQVRAHHLLRRAVDPARYAFIHAYYRELAYERVAPGRRMRLHGQVGDWLAATPAGQAGELAAELALHFERAERHDQALDHLQRAAVHALGRHAPREALHLLQRGLGLLERVLPDSPENRRRKLTLLTQLVPTLLATRGYGAPDLPQALEGTLTLARELKEPVLEFRALFGIWLYLNARGELARALDLAEHLAELSQGGDALPRMLACLAMTTTLTYTGDPAGVDHWASQGIACAEALGPLGDRLCLDLGQDPLAALLGLRAIALHLLGQARQARESMAAARHRAEAVGHPYTRTLVLFCSFWMHRDMGEPEAVRHYLAPFEELANAHGFALMGNTALGFGGWTRVRLDGDPSGIETMRQAIVQVEGSGLRLTLGVYHTQLADACLAAGRYQDGLAAIDMAFREIEFTGERRLEAETWRIRGELLARLGGAGTGPTARECYQQALAIARRQGARALELRAARSLARLIRDAGDQEGARALLRETLDQYRDDPELTDRRSTEALLARWS